MRPVRSIQSVVTERVDGGHLWKYRSGCRLRLKVLAKWVIRRMCWEARLLGYKEPCRLWLHTKWWWKWRCTECAALRKGVKGRLLLLEENRGRAAGLRVEYRRLLLLDRGEEVLHGLSGLRRVLGWA